MLVKKSVCETDQVPAMKEVRAPLFNIKGRYICLKQINLSPKKKRVVKYLLLLQGTEKEGRYVCLKQANLLLPASQKRQADRESPKGTKGGTDMSV